MSEEFDFKRALNSARLLIEVELKPTQGDRFQPTGFPDIGAAEYQRHDGVKMVLVESAQSMGNRLELTIVNSDGYNVIDDLKGISYVVSELKVKDKEESKFTSSLIEAHRINSPYIISDKTFKENLKKEASYSKGQPINWKKVAKSVFKFDVNSLIHGLFMANLEDGRLKIPRILSSFIEAQDVKEVSTGGVKINPIDPTGNLRTEQIKGNVYGNVPYHRTEYTAKRIAAYFNIDTSLLKSYELKDEENEFILGLCIYKIRKFLNSSLRLRTACDFKVVGEVSCLNENGDTFTLPDEQSILVSIRNSIIQCKDSFNPDPVTEVSVSAKWKEDENKDNNEPDTPDPDLENSE